LDNLFLCLQQHQKNYLLYIIFIPKGFAHGFQVLSKEAEITYLVDVPYKPEYDVGIVWNDEDLKIDWPIKQPILSEKDKNLPKLKEVIK
jgi:dTDP-4-dehydrorhamnose 3,5-epimerase